MIGLIYIVGVIIIELLLLFTAPLSSNVGEADPHIKHGSSIAVRVYYLATAVSLAPQFLQGANTPQYNCAFVSLF
jgi:hypothetical protein